jgi:hypothetical protein
MMGYAKQMLYNSLLCITYFQTGVIKALKHMRYERELSFDGVLPTNSSYYLDTLEGLSFPACTIKCHLSDPVCLGYLYSATLMHCKLLKTFLVESDITNNNKEGGWEYRSRAGKMSTYSDSM